MEDEHDQESVDTRTAAAAVVPSACDAKPIYFPVSLTKFVVMNFCTFGMYQFYWFYENWKFIREREQSDVSPFWRTAFAFIYCYPLFEKIWSSAASLEIGQPFSVPFLATGWILSSLLGVLPDPYAMAAFLSFLFLIPVQQTANRINESLAPGHDRNDRLTAWNTVAVVIAALLFILVVIAIIISRE
ncbi:MAG TPA: hypothetical protein VLD60_05590 [Nitrospira sp.]|nr:hypothetical protein [Nitrospira sp.]